MGTRLPLYVRMPFWKGVKERHSVVAMLQNKEKKSSVVDNKLYHSTFGFTCVIQQSKVMCKRHYIKVTLLFL